LNNASNNGNDIADDSSAGPFLYTIFTVINCVSTTTNSNSNFVVSTRNLVYDCLLKMEDKKCHKNSKLYVNRNGVDYLFCGEPQAPCYSIAVV
jgi:hypothetical protein